MNAARRPLAQRGVKTRTRGLRCARPREQVFLFAVKPLTAPDAGVEGVTQPVAEVVHGKHCQRDGDARKHDALGEFFHPDHRVSEYFAPCGEVGREADTEEAQGAFGDDRGGEAEGCRDHDGRDHVGQQVPRDDAF